MIPGALDLLHRPPQLACQVARSDLPVLITGPNGAGKEKIAEIIQANSSVKQGPFVTLNCIGPAQQPYAFVPILTPAAPSRAATTTRGACSC